MKKSLALFLTLCLLGCASALADTDVTVNGGTGATTVSLTVADPSDSYIVTIPSSIAIDTTTGFGTAAITLKKDYVIAPTERLLVTLTEAANGMPTNAAGIKQFTLKNGAHFANYHISADGGATYLTDQTLTLLTVNSADDRTQDHTAALQFKLASTSLPAAAGAYTDTLTFTIAISAAP